MASGRYDSPVVRVQVTDKDGKTMDLTKIVDEDYYSVPVTHSPINFFKEFETFNAYPDDVVICGYPKCGTHWIWEIANMLVSGSSDYVQNVKQTTMLELLPCLDALKKLPKPRVLNSHLPPRLLPPDLLAKGSRLVYLLRNPKDIVASHYNHVFSLRYNFYCYEGTFDAYLDLFTRGKVEYGNFFTYVKEWEDFMTGHPVHVIYYEDSKQDSVKEIKRLAQFLNVEIEDAVVQDIADKTEFARMKAAKAGLETEAFKQLWIDHKPAMYRKGVVGDWKNWFTVKQNEKFDAMFSGEMNGSIRRYAPHTDHV